MTTTEQLIFVCEKLLGWTDVVITPDGILVGFNPNGEKGFRTSLPPLTFDLVYECEEKLNDVQQRKYAMSLHESTNAGETFGRGLNYFRILHATKEQRLAALVATINL